MMDTRPYNSTAGNRPCVKLQALYLCTHMHMPFSIAQVLRTSSRRWGARTGEPYIAAHYTAQSLQRRDGQAAHELHLPRPGAISCGRHARHAAGGLCERSWVANMLHLLGPPWPPTQCAAFGWAFTITPR